MNTPRLLLLLGLTGALVVPARAYDSPGPLAKIPPHTCPWVETTQTHPDTLFLWKFSSDAEQAAGVEALLDNADLADVGTAGKPALDLPDAKDRVEPALHDGARVEAGAGRFGGGLVLDGSGHAAAQVPLRDLVEQFGGFTLDLWYRTAPAAPEAAAAALVTLGDLRNEPLLRVDAGPAGAVVLQVDGEKRLSVAATPSQDGWHHLILRLSAPRGQPDALSAALTVDDRTAEAARPDWLKRLHLRLGRALLVGGAPGQPGLRGTVDEVRLSRGTSYLYAYGLGWQAFGGNGPLTELKPPFFRSGQVLTQFHFDADLKPAAFAGRAWTGTADATLFQPGIRGQALDLSRIDKSGFRMTGFGILPEKDGTVEFWFRPLDWNNFYVGEYDGRDVPYQWLLTLTAKDALHATPSKNIEVMKGRACRDMDLRWQRIHPGTWTHVLISVSNGGPTVYLNGQRQKLWQAGLVLRGHPFSQEPLKKWRERTGGKDVDDTWTLAFVQSPTLVDEFTVYASAMTPEEAWNAYARWLPDATAQMKPLPVFRIDFDYFAHSWNLKEKLVVRLACLPVGDVKPASADCELRTVAGASSSGLGASPDAGAGMLPPTLLSVEKQPLDATGTTAFTLNRALPFGRYAVVVRSRGADGVVLKEEKQEYVREKPAWFGTALGKDRTVPEPWTPIAVEKQTLRVIGREIELGANGLPRRIEARKQSLLAAPVTVRAGNAELAGQGPPTFSETAPDRAAWKATLAGAGLAAEVDAWLEFDGLLYCAITLKPTAGAEAALDDLDVDVPLNPALATQLLANGGGNDFRASWLATFLPAGEGSIWDSLKPTFSRAHGVTNYLPHLWVGSDDVGLYFGAENDQGWTVDGPKPAQEIRRENGAVVVRLNIIREPTAIPAAGRRFHFVLLPTPAKPEPPDWRRQMLAGGVNFGSCDSFGGFDMKTDPADPNQGDTFLLEPRSWEHAAKMAPQSRAKWGRCILYADASWAQPGPAFRDWNHDLHAGTGRHAWTPEFEDYVVWAVNEFLRRGLIDGVYWDDVSVGYTYSLASTAYEYQGRENGRRVGFTALAQRRANMRLWRLFVAAGKEPCIWAHMTVCYEVPLFSFCRYLSNCEFVTGVDFPGARDAMDMWSPETLRVLGGSAKWGTGYHCLTTLPRTLPDSAAAKQWLYPQARTEDALYLTNDIMQLSGSLAQKLTAERVFADPVQVFPWWRAGEVVSLAAPDGAQLLAGVYALGDRAIVVVANRERKTAREVTVSLKFERLLPGAKGVRWRDLDPGLEPPKAVVASAEELKALAAGPDDAAITGQEAEMTATDLADALEGTTPEGRAQKDLELRTDGNAARVLVRPRDYRVLEATPAP